MSTSQLLTVNLVLPAAGGSGEEAVSFTRLLFGLAALALKQFGAAQPNDCPDSMRESFHPWLAGVPADPFDGQLLRFRQVEAGYQLHSAGHHPPVGERDLGSQVIDSTLL
jgi:hypothetical protein